LIALLEPWEKLADGRLDIAAVRFILIFLAIPICDPLILGFG
jgi:hypothetical protein